jgi:predicted nuclease with RNAse H fold
MSTADDPNRPTTRRPITHAEALRIADDIMERAERGREEAAEREAGIESTGETLLPPQRTLAGLRECVRRGMSLFATMEALVEEIETHLEAEAAGGET